MYFITAMEKLEKGKDGWLGIGCSRCFGYYINEEDSFKVVIENKCDINESIYDYAVIEKIGCGIHSICDKRWWFKFDYKKRQYFQIDEPDYTKNTINFAIG